MLFQRLTIGQPWWTSCNKILQTPRDLVFLAHEYTLYMSLLWTFSDRVQLLMRTNYNKFSQVFSLSLCFCMYNYYGFYLSSQFPGLSYSHRILLRPYWHQKLKRHFHILTKPYPALVTYLDLVKRWRNHWTVLDVFIRVLWFYLSNSKMFYLFSN